MADSNRKEDVTTSGFFAFRTPLLPFDELLRWGEGLEAAGTVDDPEQLERALAADSALLRSRLKAIVARPEVREALFVGSPSLDERFEVWFRDPDSERGQKVERAIIRYFLRMASRPTPFGLFAGCSVGTLGSETHLAMDGWERYRRHTRLDMDYLCALTDALGREEVVKKALRYRPNNSIYHAAGRLRYVETRLRDKVRSHHLVAVETSDYLDATLERARDGALPSELAQALVEADPEVSPAEAEEYVEELIDSQLLVSDLPPVVTGPEPIHGLVTHLREFPGTEEAAVRLDQTRRALDAIDAAPLGVEPKQYRAIATDLEQLPTKVELARLFQVDMVKPALEAMLGQAPLDEIIQGVERLRRLVGDRVRDRFSAFRQAFAARYESREVPLVEVLDEEVGIGFERSNVPGAEASPLLEDLAFPATIDDSTTPWSVRHTIMLRKLGEALADGAHEITLETSDLERMESTDPLPLPDAFSVMATLCAASREAVAKGDFRVVLGGVFGPSGANLLGRFCHADPALKQYVGQHLRAEESLEPEAVFAEIVHLPEGRIGNILSRPVMRDYEIPFLGRSGVPFEREIPIADLLVSVRGDRVVLRSARLGREVIPRLTSAHNIAHPRNLGAYRFLCTLQQQGVAGGLSWDWGALSSEPFLPRIVTGRLVLSRARWLMSEKELKPLVEARGAERFKLVHEWRVERNLPRFVALADGDNVLCIDLDNVLNVETLIHLIKDRGQVVFTELLPGPDELCAHGPEGRFAHELVIPFVRTREASPRRLPASMTPVPKRQRVFPLGSEWLYAKLYTGTSTADHVLREVVGPAVREVVRSGAADGWFFIRYGDPDWHLRLRLYGEPEALGRIVLPAIEAATAPLLDDGRLWRVQWDTYEREIERYGGLEGTILAEKLFHADSEAVLAIVETLSGDEGADARWRLAVCGIDMLLADLGMDPDGKKTVLERVREGFGREFRADTTYLKHQLGDKYRKERKSLELLLDRGGHEDSPLQPGLVVLHRRSERSAPIVAELHTREKEGRLSLSLMELAPSYIHMHVNRLLRSAQRAQELVLYDFLHRIYESRLARLRKGKRKKASGGSTGR